MQYLCSVKTLAFSAAAVFTFSSTLHAVGIGASEDQNLPTTNTQHFGNQGSGFNITADVFLDPSAGRWVKSLTNNGGQSIASGVEVFITETLTNVGNIPWTDWHEEIISLSTIGGGGGSPVPGFLFRNNSLNLQADYGGGFVGLSQGVDYTLQTMDYNGPPFSGNDNNWEAVWIFFEPHAVIQPGDTLRVEKRIFEVFGDADVWRPGESALIAQYPTPEPATAALLMLAAPVLLRRR